MGVEFELKYSAEPAQQEKIRQQYMPEYEQFRMQTTYYDTPSGALSKRRITLRCRLENGQAVCTVVATVNEVNPAFAAVPPKRPFIAVPSTEKSVNLKSTQPKLITNNAYILPSI